MPSQVAYNASEGLPTAPGRFVIRQAGLLVRAPDALPMLFASLALAQAEAERLTNGQ